MSLWYRCLLEVILTERCPEITRKAKENHNDDDEKFIQIGRKLIKEKSVPSFNEYVRKALNKINLNEKLSLSDDDIESYWNRFKDLKIRFDLFNQYKLICAPIIEYIILLDRMIFLYEFDLEHLEDNAKHHLIKIFDGAKSPRCHALISFS